MPVGHRVFAYHLPVGRPPRCYVTRNTARILLRIFSSTGRAVKTISATPSSSIWWALRLLRLRARQPAHITDERRYAYAVASDSVHLTQRFVQVVSSLLEARTYIRPSWTIVEGVRLFAFNSHPPALAHSLHLRFTSTPISTMPPRRSKTTPKASAPPSPPAAPRRRQSSRSKYVGTCAILLP